MKKDFELVILLFLSSVAFAGIAPIVVELPGFVGEYPSVSGKVLFDYGRPIPFEIANVSLTIEGTYSPGIALIGGTEYTDPFHYGFFSEISLGVMSPEVWWNPMDPPMSQYLPAAFKFESFYQKIGNANWDFLADGQAEIPLGFGYGAIRGGTIITKEAYAELTNVTLTIYPIPEPMTICLFVLGAVMMRRKAAVLSF
jgi:hypothetical protein